MTSAPEDRIIEQAAGSGLSSRAGAAVGDSPGLDVTPESWEPALRRRLRQAPPNAEALLDLYEHVAPAVYGYARQRTRSRRKAYETALSAFVEAAHHPGVFDDARISMRIQMLLIVHLRTS